MDEFWVISCYVFCPLQKNHISKSSKSSFALMRASLGWMCVPVYWNKYNICFYWNKMVWSCL